MQMRPLRHYPELEGDPKGDVSKHCIVIHGLGNLEFFLGVGFSSYFCGCKLCEMEDWLKQTQDVECLVDPRLSTHDEDSWRMLGPTILGFKDNVVTGSGGTSWCTLHETKKKKKDHATTLEHLSFGWNKVTLKI